MAKLPNDKYDTKYKLARLHKEIYKRQASGARTTGVWKDTIDFVKANPDVMRRLVSDANRDLRSLRSHKSLGKSQAYQKAKYQLSKSGGAFTSRIKDDKYIERLLKFTHSSTKNYKGLKAVRRSKADQLVEQIIKNAYLSVEDKAVLEEYLRSLSDAQVTAMAQRYEYELSKDFNPDSKERFEYVAADIAEKAIKSRRENAQNMADQFVNSAYMTQAEEIVDPVDATLSVQDAKKIVKGPDKALNPPKSFGLTLEDLQRLRY